MPSDSNKVSSSVEYISDDQYTRIGNVNSNIHVSPMTTSTKDDALWGTTRTSARQYTTIPLQSGGKNNGGMINGIDSTSVNRLSELLNLGRSGNITAFKESVDKGELDDILNRKH